MEKTKIVEGCPAGKVEKRDDIQEGAIQNLPPQVIKWDGIDLQLYQGFWYSEPVIQGMKSFQQHFQAHDNDLILATAPKAGTTWLKALTFSILNRNRYSLKQSPLLTNNPHDLVPFLECEIYLKTPFRDLENLPCPRIFSTHAPYVSLPSSIKSSRCKIVYISRNPLDNFNSYWHFNPNMLPFWESVGLGQNKFQAMSLDEMFNLYCQGVSICGPFLDHVLGYWNASLERPDKVLFLKYEDMKEDIIFHAKRLAEFLGFPFSTEEEKQGVIGKITKLCSLENLKDLQVNKTGKQPYGVQNNAFFRKGKVGDWADYLTPSMAERMKKLMEEKLAGSGLTF